MQCFLGWVVNSLDSAVYSTTSEREGQSPSEQTSSFGTCSFKDIVWHPSSSTPSRCVGIMSAQLFQPVQVVPAQGNGKLVLVIRERFFSVIFVFVHVYIKKLHLNLRNTILSKRVLNYVYFFLH